MLTPKQEKFVQGIIEGMSQADAYRSAYSCARMSDKTIWENASRLMADSKVKARVQELRDRIATDSIMSAQERLEYLTRVVKGIEVEKVTQIVDGAPIEIEVPVAVKTRLSAIDLMNKMQGEYVTKVDANVATDITINVELTDE